MNVRHDTEFAPSTVQEQIEDALQCPAEYRYPGYTQGAPAYGIIGTYQRTETGKHTPFRLRVEWPAVTKNVEGGDVDVDSYTVQIQSKGPNDADYEGNKRTKVIKDPDASSDGVDDPGPPTHCLFYNIRPKRIYRVRVRAGGPNGICKSPYTPWVVLGSAADNVAPAAPTSVALEIDNHRAIISWDPPLDPDDSGIADTNDRDIDQGVTYFQWQLSTSNTYATIYKKGRTSGDRRTVKIQKPGTTTYYARVRSFDAAGNKSSWVTTNSSKTAVPTPSAPSIAFDALGPRGRPRALVTVTAVTTHGEDLDYIVQFVHKSGSASPTSSDHKFRQRVDGDETSNGLRAVFKNLRRDHYTFARVRAVDSDGDRSAWSSWTSGGVPSASTTVSTPTGLTASSGLRRVSAQWDDDDEIEKYKVVVKRGTTTVQTVYKKASHHNYHVAKAYAGSGHSITVSAIDGSGNESSTTSTSTLYPGDEYTAADIDVAKLDEFTADAGIITAGTFQGVQFTTNSGTDSNYITIDGSTSGGKDRISFTSSSASSHIQATDGGIRIGITSGANVAFYGATPTSRPAKITDANEASPTALNCATRINEIIDRLETLGLIAPN